MDKTFYRLAFSGLKRRKQSTILLWLVLFLSFTFAIITLSVTESMNKTNQIFLRDTYGTWDGAIANGTKEDQMLLEHNKEIGSIGTSVQYGTVGGYTGIGTVGDDLIKMGRLDLQAGRFPIVSSEIAIEADVLSHLGYNYKIGQQITVPIQIPATLPDTMEDSFVTIERQYTLCGVIKEYTDLWIKDNNQQLNGALITEESAKRLQDYAAAENPKAGIKNSVTSYFFTAVHDRGIMFSSLDKKMKEIREKEEDITFGKSDNKNIKKIQVNTFAHSDDMEVSYHYYYLFLILLITVFAVISIYLVQIKKQIRQIALFRSIGITKKQLRILLVDETLLTVLPAMLAGLAAGAFFTWVSLKLLLQTSMSKFYVSIPWIQLLLVSLLWLVAIFSVRMFIFRIALHQPLIGQILMQSKSNRRDRRLQKIRSSLLSIVLCAALIFISIQGKEDIFDKNQTQRNPSYFFDKYSQIFKSDSKISENMLKKIEAIPGIRHVTAWNIEQPVLKFDGISSNDFVNAIKDERQKNEEMKEKKIIDLPDDGLPVSLYAIRERNWEDYLNFEELGISRESFRRGDEVVMLFPVNSQGKVEANKNFYENIGLKQGDKIELSFYGVSYKRDDKGTIILDEKDKEIKPLSTVYPRVKSIIKIHPDQYNNPLQLFLGKGYQVICSDFALEQIIKTWPKNYFSGINNEEEFSGYEMGEAYTSSNSEYLSTDYVLADFCEKENIQLDSKREENMATLQEVVQKLTQTFFTGAAIFLIALLLIWNILYLGAKSNRKNIAIFQVLGMSQKQMRRKRCLDSLKISVISVFGGWAIYGSYIWLSALKYNKFHMEAFQEKTSIVKIIRYNLESAQVRGAGWLFGAMVSFLGISIIFLLNYYANKRACRGNTISILREETL